MASGVQVLQRKRFGFRDIYCEVGIHPHFNCVFSGNTDHSVLDAHQAIDFKQIFEAQEGLTEESECIFWVLRGEVH